MRKIKEFLLVLFLVFVIICGFKINAYAIEDTNNNKNSTGVYKIAVGKMPNKAIEVKGGYTNNNAIIDIWDYGNATWQNFYFQYNKEGYYVITAMHTRKSLTVKENKLEEGMQIVQSDYEGLDSQKWILRDSGKNGWIISLLSNPNLSITIKDSITNGAEMTLSKTEDNDNQMFYLYNITSELRTHTIGIYKMSVGKEPNKAIEVKGGYKNNNDILDIWDYGNALWQRFYFKFEEEGYYIITAMHTGKCLTVKENKLEEGTHIVQSDYKGLDSQKWILRDSNKNGWTISLLSNPNLSITIEGNIANGAEMILSDTKNSNNQMFYLYNITSDVRTHPDGVYKMSVGKEPNKAIEVKGSDKNNNAIVDIWDYGNGNQQRFNFEYKEGFYKITARHTGKSLTVKNGNCTEGTEIVQADYQGLDSQKWILRDSNKNGWIISLLSNPNLSITIKGNIKNGSDLILSKTEDNDNQMFYLNNITSNLRTHEDKTYKITIGASPNKAMEVKGGYKSNNDILDIWDYGNVTWQRFNLEYKEGFYKIIATHTGKVLTVKNNNLKDGAEIVQYDYQGLDSQKWILRDSNKNGWIISLMSNPNLSITVSGRIENGSKLILSTTQDNNNQMFYISPCIDKNIKEGTYGQSGLRYKGTGGSYLKYYQIGKGNKHLFLNFAIHGFEDNYNYDGQELTYIADEFYKYLQNNMEDNLVEEWTIYIMPSLNPDGEYNGWTKDGPGRTTLYSWAPGNQGIDMNRCFSVSYKREKGARNYNGTEPFQAYEAQALRDFILNNRGNQNIVIDVHGWLNETIGDNEIGGFYRNTFGISKHIGSYGSGYLVNWARSIGARSMLLELPPVYSHSQVVNNNYVSKFTNATMNLLRSF